MLEKSPVPVPEQSVFNTRVFSEKKTPLNNPKCPSPPLKTPPVSRIFSSQPAKTPTAKLIQTPTATPHVNVQEQALIDLPQGTSFFEQYFENLGEIGSGSFGHVFKALSRQDSRYYALKRSRHQFRGTKDRERALGEVWFAAQLPPHPHVLHYINAWEEQGYLFIQTELCEMGTLKDFLENAEPFDEETIWNYLVDMILGIQHLHAHNLLHLDIKPANLFLTSGGHLKIGDFGLVQHLGTLPTDVEGDSRYMALELLNEDKSLVSFPADIFCIGATIFEMATNLDMPSNGDSWAELRRGNAARYVPSTRSPELQLLIGQMMAPDPGQRPTAAQLLSHWKLRLVFEQRKYPPDLLPLYQQPHSMASLSQHAPAPLIVPTTPASAGSQLFSPSGALGDTVPSISTVKKLSNSKPMSDEQSELDLSDDEFLVNPKSLSSIFSRENLEREQQRRESLETYGVVLSESCSATRTEDLIVPIAPRNLLNVFNTTCETMDE